MELVADIETNGLYHNVTQIHCIVTKDIETGQVKKFFDAPISVTPDGTIEDGVRHLAAAEVVVGHNWIDYDARVIRKFYPWYHIDVDKIRDTYIRSMMFDPHRQKHPDCPVSKGTPNGRSQIGAHSLENWGYEVGRGKVEYEDWNTFDEEMLRRCVEDVEITYLVDQRLKRDAKDWDWSLSEWLEKSFQLVMSEQEGHGWLFDINKANKCVADLTAMVDEIDSEVVPRIPPVVKADDKIVDKIRKKDGGYTSNFIKWFDKAGLGDCFLKQHFVGPFCRVVFEPINLASDKQVKDYLLSVGWVPTEWNYKKNGKRVVKGEDGKPIKTSPKLTEDSFESLSDDTGKLIARRITVCHRRSQIEGWINSVRDDGRIGAGGNACGTNTGRVTHRTIVNVPKADDDVFFGKRMRELFIVPEGYKLVGADLSSLEDRLAGHHTHKYDNGDYARELLEGDPHQKTADLFKTTRHKGKTCNHALKYGAQSPKLASILAIGDRTAQRYWNMWWDNHPSLKTLKMALEAALRKRGFSTSGRLPKEAFIKGLDGRKIFLRSAHSVLNARIQNAGSVVHKLVCVYIDQGIKDKMLNAYIVGNFHDETQVEVLESDVEEYLEVLREAEDKVNNFFKFKIPMKLEANVGTNWMETH